MTTSFAAATSSSPDADPRAEEPNPFEESFALAATKRLPSDHHQTEQVKFMTEVASSLNHNSTAAAVVLPSIDKLAVSSTAISTMVDNPPLKRTLSPLSLLMCVGDSSKRSSGNCL